MGCWFPSSGSVTTARAVRTAGAGTGQGAREALAVPSPPRNRTKGSEGT